MLPPTEILLGPSKLKIYHKGPGLDQGPLPSLFYFALSGAESLEQDPFNQPVAFLATDPIRVFSFTIPGHGEGLLNPEAMSFWSQEMMQNHNIIAEFVSQGLENIQYLIDQGYADPLHLAVGGLSRGGFVAAHLAANDPRIRIVLGFAPLTKLTYLKEFEGMQNPIAASLNLSNLLDKLIDKKIRFYIGNRDIRVGTEECFQFIHALAEAAYEKGIRSPKTELIIASSIGHKGHGTSIESFKDGAMWVKKELISSN